MYLAGEKIFIENVADREAAYLAAIAADPTRPTPLPNIRKLQPPFELGRGSKDIIARGLANISLERFGMRYTLSPERADELLDDLYGEIDRPEDFEIRIEEPRRL